MDDKTTAIYSSVKELTLDFVSCKRDRKATVRELKQRVDANFVYRMEGNELLFEAFVSLEHLTEKGFATSFEEMKYLSECFEGKREFSRVEARQFIVGPFQDENPPS